MSEKWKQIAFEILKYAFGAILGIVGITASGCLSVPQFFFA